MEHKKIGIFVNRKRDQGLKVTKSVVDCIKRHDMKPLLFEDDAGEIGIEQGYVPEYIYENADIAVSLGGDGTLLNMARSLFDHDIPVFGINLGTVGFLAEVEVHEIESAIHRISKEDYTLIDRMVLSSKLIRSGKKIFESIALNDVVVSRGGLSRIVRLKVYVNDHYIDSFPGDGVIVSTPTGSTAYTLSAGGPIVQPDMQMMITTPICPHILYSRSFITGPEEKLSIHIDEEYPDSAIVTMDGQEGYDVKAGDRILIEKKHRAARFVSIQHVNFYDVLRAKIHGQGQ